MKKTLIIIMMFFISIITIKAYESDYFKIDIPNNYKETIIEDAVYKWENNNKYIAIKLSFNSLTKYNVKDYTEEEIQKQKEYIEEKLNESLKEYNIEATVSRIEKLHDDNYYYLEYDIYYPSKTLYGYNTYQRGRMYTTKNYITAIVYNSDKEITNDDEEIKSLNSIYIKDDEFTRRDYKRSLLLMITIGIILGIFGYFTEKKKRK